MDILDSIWDSLKGLGRKFKDNISNKTLESLPEAPREDGNVAESINGKEILEKILDLKRKELESFKSAGEQKDKEEEERKNALAFYKLSIDSERKDIKVDRFYRTNFIVQDKLTFEFNTSEDEKQKITIGTYTQGVGREDHKKNRVMYDLANIKVKGLEPGDAYIFTFPRVNSQTGKEQPECFDIVRIDHNGKASLIMSTKDPENVKTESQVRQIRDHKLENISNIKVVKESEFDRSAIMEERIDEIKKQAEVEKKASVSPQRTPSVPGNSKGQGIGNP